MNQCLNLIRFQTKTALQTKIFDYPIYNLKMLTCGNLYKYSKHIKTYKISPLEGLEIDVEYADSAAGIKNVPVVVALHGHPGSHQDFKEVIQYFSSRNCRVIVPNFPGYEYTKWNLGFWHSAEERAQFIRDLLRILGLKTIDLLLCHSSALYPASFLWSEDVNENKDFKVKSVAMLNPPNWKYLSQLQIFLANFFAMFISYSNFGRKYLIKSLNPKFFMPIFGTKDIERPEDALINAYIIAFSRIESIHKRYLSLFQKNISTMILMSENDEYFSPESFYSFAQELGLSQANLTVYDKIDDISDIESENKDELELISDDNSDLQYHILNIKPGDHHCFMKHHHIVNHYLEILLQKTIKK